MDELVYDPTKFFTEQQKECLSACTEKMNGLSFYEAEQVLFELMNNIKKQSIIIIIENG